VDVHLERRDRRAWGLLAPQSVDELVTRHHRVRVEEQDGQQRALLGRAERQRFAVVDDLDRSEDPKFDARRPPS